MYIQIVLVIAISLVALAGMARGRKRRFRPYLSGNIDRSFTLGTLAANTGILSSGGSTVVDTTFCSSIECNYAMNNYTGVNNAGPIRLYAVHSDYALSEAEQYIESSGSWDQGDKIQQEQRSRKVKLIGQFYPQGGSGAGATNDMNQGRKLKTKLNWLLNEGDTIQFLAYNAGSAALSTTDPAVVINGKANLWPQ